VAIGAGFSDTPPMAQLDEALDDQLIVTLAAPAS
jgi:hypothetical protein